MHRWMVVVVFLAASLAGCTSSDDAGEAALDATDAPGGADEKGSGAQVPPADTSAAAAATELLSGTAAWHSATSHGPTYPLTLAAQPVVNVCISGAENGAEPYMTNLDLSEVFPVQTAPAGTAALEVSLSWDVQDYAGDALVLAYKASRDDAWTESPYLPNGETTVVPIEPLDGDARIDLWLCVSRDGGGTEHDPTEGPKFFAGDVDVTVRALPA